jgi:hypothetical protein
MTLSVMQGTSCGSVVAAMGDTAAAVGLCLDHNSGAYSAANLQGIQTHQDKGREKERGSRTNVKLAYAVRKGGR